MRRLGLLFGGRSGEHEISILSAASMIEAIDGNRYEIVKIGINKSGGWYLIEKDMSGIESLDDDRLKTLIPDGSGAETGGAAKPVSPGDIPALVDFVFPALHGPYGEDGRMQGLLETLNVPYGGCGVACSAVAMDKIFTREIWARAGLPVCGHVALFAEDYKADPGGEIDAVESALGYPVFVKPANLGSSVGISKAKSREGLKEGIAEALKYDRRLIVEECVNCRELETGVLGNRQVLSAAVGEIIPAAEFYDYESKYRDAGTAIVVPADIPADTAKEIKNLAEKAYCVLNGEGFARVDFFLERETGRIFINEINTIPGFTKYSMFPLLWKEAGLPYGELIERIVELGYERYFSENHRKANGFGG